MSDQRWLPNVLLAGIIGVSLIICSFILMATVARVKTQQRTIRVSGSARQMIRSDLIIWKGRVTVRGTTIGEAYQTLSANVKKTWAYLESKGVPAKEILDTPVETRTLYAAPTTGGPEAMYLPENVYREVVAYELTQGVEVRSANVDLVDELARKATELISEGVVFESRHPEYIYTKLSETKVAILAEAAKDARERAEQIAQNSGCRLGAVRSARMSPLRITPAYQLVELDSYGVNDTSSLDKEITAVVSVEYLVR